MNWLITRGWWFRVLISWFDLIWFSKKIIESWCDLIFLKIIMIWFDFSYLSTFFKNQFELHGKEHMNVFWIDKDSMTSLLQSQNIAISWWSASNVYQLVQHEQAARDYKIQCSVLKIRMNHLHHCCCRIEAQNAL